MSAAALPPEPISPAHITHRFTNHPPASAYVGDVLDELTERFIDLGKHLAGTLPPGREASLAVTKLEEASMWSKAAVARNQGPNR